MKWMGEILKSFGFSNAGPTMDVQQGWLREESGGKETPIYRNFLTAHVRVDIFLLLGSSPAALTSQQEGNVRDCLNSETTPGVPFIRQNQVTGGCPTLSWFPLFQVSLKMGTPQTKKLQSRAECKFVPFYSHSGHLVWIYVLGFLKMYFMFPWGTRKS